LSFPDKDGRLLLDFVPRPVLFFHGDRSVDGFSTFPNAGTVFSSPQPFLFFFGQTHTPFFSQNPLYAASPPQGRTGPSLQKSFLAFPILVSGSPSSTWVPTFLSALRLICYCPRPTRSPEGATRFSLLPSAFLFSTFFRDFLQFLITPDLLRNGRGAFAGGTTPVPFIGDFFFQTQEKFFLFTPSFPQPKMAGRPAVGEMFP